MHSKISYLIPKIKLIFLFDLCFIIIFGIIYYNLQFWVKNAFIRSTVEETGNHVSKIKKFTILECIHFSLVTQSTIGYGGIIPNGNISVIINSMQIISIYLIPLTMFLLK